MVVGLKDLEMVGAVRLPTVRVAVLLPDPAVGVCVVVTPYVFLMMPPPPVPTPQPTIVPYTTL